MLALINMKSYEFAICLHRIHIAWIDIARTSSHNLGIKIKSLRGC